MVMPGRYLILNRNYMGKVNIKKALVALIINIGMFKNLFSNNFASFASAPISDKYFVLSFYGLYSSMS
jgi:hypothetical protein